MEALKNPKPKSKVQQFYHKFNSHNSDSSSSSSEDDDGPAFFTFKTPKAPSIRSENKSPNYYYQPPISPGLSKNQDIKDQAYEMVFKRRIDDLKS